MELGKRIDHRLKELELTQVELARKSGLTQQVISQYIRGKSKPGYDAIVGLLKALEVNSAWFFEESEPAELSHWNVPLQKRKPRRSAAGSFSDVIVFPRSGKPPQRRTFVLGHWFPMQNVASPNQVVSPGIIFNFYWLIFNQLVQMVAVRQPKGMLAIDWKPIGNSWVFQLREGVSFHDGTPFKATDVAWSYNQYLRRNPHERRIESVEVLDRNLIQIHLKSRCRLEEVAMPFILPEGTKADAPQWIGTGPFHIMELNPGFWRLRRNPHYFLSGLYFQEVHIREYPDALALEKALLAGEVHFAIGIDCPSDNHIVKAEPTALRYHLHFMLKDPLVQNPLLRKAIAMALDREALAKAAGLKEPLYSVGPFDYLLGDRAQKPPRPDIETAKLLLSQVSGVRDTVFRVEFYPTVRGDRSLADAIVTQLNRIGLQAEIGAPGLMKLLLRPAEPLESEYALWKTKTFQNVNDYSNPQVDECIRRLQEISVTESQLLELRGLIQRDLPDLPLFYFEVPLTYVRTLRARENQILLLRGLNDIHNWYLDEPTQAESQQDRTFQRPAVS